MSQYKYGAALHCTIDSIDGAIVVGDSNLFESIVVSYVSNDLEKLEQHAVKQINDEDGWPYKEVYVDRQCMDGDDSLLGNEVVEAGKLVSLIKCNVDGDEIILMAVFEEPPVPEVIE